MKLCMYTLIICIFLSDYIIPQDFDILDEIFTTPEEYKEEINIRIT